MTRTPIPRTLPLFSQGVINALVFLFLFTQMLLKNQNVYKVCKRQFLLLHWIGYKITHIYVHLSQCKISHQHSQQSHGQPTLTCTGCGGHLQTSQSIYTAPPGSCIYVSSPVKALELLCLLIALTLKPRLMRKTSRTL